MKNKAVVSIMLICIMLSSTFGVFAGDAEDESFSLRLGSDSKTGFSITAYDDYTCTTTVEDTGFNAGVFSMDANIRDVDWLGITGTRSCNITVRTGSSNMSILELMPDLVTLGMAERMAYVRLTGNTFACGRFSRWSEETGSWETGFDTPYGNIRKALDDFRQHMTCEPAKLRIDRKTKMEWFDNIILIPAGTVVRYGRSEVRFAKTCSINDLKTEVSFKKCLRLIRNASEISDNGNGQISIWLPKGASLTLCETSFTLDDSIKIAVNNGNDLTSDADPLRGFIEAINAKTIDSDTVVRTAAGILNELCKDLASEDVNITVEEEAPPQEVTEEKKDPEPEPAVEKKRIQPKSIAIKNGKKVKLRKGKKHQIKASVKPGNCSYKITYKSSNKKVAKVSARGKVRAIRKGKAKITVKCGKLKRTVLIIVKR